ncbi:hypothetical protein CKO17_16815 [Marichromatium gracile]|nr:hypothetical protein [Marichromatium gracile]
MVGRCHGFGRGRCRRDPVDRHAALQRRLLPTDQRDPGGLSMAIDPMWRDVVLLLPCWGGDGAQQLVDYSGARLPVSLRGGAMVSVDGARSEAGALYLDGSGAYVTINDLSRRLAGVPAFTIEGWFFRASDNAGQDVLFGFHSSLGANRAVFDASKYFGDEAAATTSYPSAMPIGVWFHFAVVRRPSAWQVYLDGTRILDLAAAPNTLEVTDRFSVGQEWDGASPSDFWHGYVEDLRVTLGVRYEAGFEPPGRLLTLTDGGYRAEAYSEASEPINGSARRGDGTPADSVLVRDWISHEPVAIATPDAAGDWSVRLVPGQYDITYLATGCAPVCHGPYTVPASG